MPTIIVSTIIRAPPERIFDLARSIDLHLDTSRRSREQAVGGVTSGLIGLGQEVRWSGRHLGVQLQLTVRITAFARPWRFTDTQVAGPFARFEHEHHFAPTARGTRMRDVLRFASPLGMLGRLVDAAVLGRLLRSFLIGRNRVLTATAEGGSWRSYLPTQAHQERA